MSDTKTFSEVDHDRVVVTLRQVDRIAEDLRLEYPQAFGRSTPGSVAQERSVSLRATSYGQKLEV